LRLKGAQKRDYSSKEGLLSKTSVFLFMNGIYPFPLPPVADLFKNKRRRFNFSSENCVQFKNLLSTQHFLNSRSNLNPSTLRAEQTIILRDWRITLLVKVLPAGYLCNATVFWILRGFGAQIS